MERSQFTEIGRARAAAVAVSGLLTAVALVSTAPAGAGSAVAVATETPTETPTGTPTATPTRTPAPTPDPIERTITVGASPRLLTVGESVTLAGQMTSADVSCISSKPVQLQRRTLGTTTFVDAGTTTTDDQGAFSRELAVQASAHYVAVAVTGAQDPCGAATSEEEKVLVKVIVSGTARPSTPPRKSEFHISGRVSPVHPGTKVVLERLVDGEWRWAGATELGSRSDYDFTKRARWRGKRVFRVKWPAADQDHESGKTGRIKVKTTAARKPR